MIKFAQAPTLNPPTRLMRFLERPARRAVTVIDATATRVYGWAGNPVHQAGTMAVAMLLVLTATGLYLIFIYRVGSPWASVARLAADPWLGAWMRSLHRYASDVFVVAGALHLLRMFAQARSWGPRTLAWVSGLVLFGTGLVCAWTGFVMAWDTFGERLAREGARLQDALPIFSEPLARIFAGPGPVPSAWFFVNLFIHIGVPLAMGAALWLHVTRLARPVLLPPRRILWTTIGVLTALAVFVPATLGPAGDPFRIVSSTPLDLVAAWWLPLSERVAPGVAWGAMSAPVLLLLFVPRLVRRPRESRWAPSAVDARLCTGCNQCVEDCPWDAITMVKRDDDRPTLLASVKAARCVSCGICAGSCAPMGVGPSGRTGRDQLAELRDAMLPGVERPDRAPVVAVCCERTPASHLAALRERRAHVHVVSCVGNLHSSVVESFVRAGMPGVIVYGCPPRDCTSREGPKWLHERLFNDREAELKPRVDRRRVAVATAAPGDLRGTIEAWESFARTVAHLERPTPEDGMDLDAVCEPVLPAAPAALDEVAT